MGDTVPNAQLAGKRPERRYVWSQRDIRRAAASSRREVSQPPGFGDVRGAIANPRLTPGGRLQLLRHHMGFLTAADCGRAIGVNPVTYQHHENGTRGVSRKAAARYAAYFGVSASMLLYGGQPVLQRDVPVTGAIGAAGEITPRMLTNLQLPETTPAPPLADDELAALVVTTDDLYPAYRFGDVVFYSPPAEGPVDTDALDGRECVVITEDGDELLRVVHRAGPGMCMLSSYHGASAIPAAARLRSAAPVLWVQRGGWKPPRTQ